MNLEQEQSNSDVQESASSEQTESTVNQQEQVEQTESAKPALETKQQDMPFHEHPRFRELVEQKNSALEQAKSLRDQYTRMEQQLAKLMESQKPKQEDPLLARLKQIDPEFGERFEKLTGVEKELEELRQFRQEVMEQQFVSSAVSKVKELHGANKVEPELAARYERELDAMYRQGSIRSLEDVEKAYKSVHEEYSKLLDNIRRKERESYVSAKKADTKLPASQPKGKPAPQGKKMEFSKDPSEARAQLVKQILNRSTAENEL